MKLSEMTETLLEKLFVSSIFGGVVAIIFFGITAILFINNIIADTGFHYGVILTIIGTIIVFLTFFVLLKRRYI